MSGFRMISRIVLVVAVITVITGCTISNGRSFNHKAQKQVQVSSPVQPAALIYTNLTHTDMTVSGGSTNECSVVADLTISATSREIADEVVQKPELYKDDYHIHAKMAVTMPIQNPVEIHTTHGDCRFENIKQTVTVHSTHGDFVLDSIEGDITAGTTHGDVDIANTKGALFKVNTTHGKISLTDCVIQQIHCTTSHNPIHLKAISSDSLSLQTSHDPIELISCSAKEAVLTTSHDPITGNISGINRVTAHTTHGPIHLRCMNDTNPEIIAELNTTHDKIEFCPPVGFAGHVSISTSHAHIRTDLPIMVQGEIGENQLQGTIGEGNGSINLATTHGDIILKSPK